MDFGLSDDQQLLEETVRGFLAEHASIQHVRELRDAGRASDRALWRGLAELGATGVLIPEAHGGSGLSLLDAALVSQALGRAVAPTPFLSSAVMVPVAFHGLHADECGVWLDGLATGDLVFGVAVTETFSLREGAGVKLERGHLHGLIRGEFQGHLRGQLRGHLRGKAMMAIDVLDADHVLVVLDHHRLAVVDARAQGLTATRLTTIDATRSTAELRFDAVHPEAVLEDRGDAIARMLDAGRIALAADALGAAEAMLAQAVAYALQRRQFDRVIGSFQAVKHLCAEMAAELEPARALLWYAAHSFDALPEETPLLACHVLAHVSEIARGIASVATQVHGGIGWTDEQNLHFWFKRIGVDRVLLGGPEWLRARAAALQGFAAAS